MVEIIFSEDVDLWLRELAKEKAAQYRSLATGQPVDLWVERILLDSARVLDDAALQAGGSRLRQSARGFHVWAMSSAAAAITMRIGRKDKGRITLKDNRGFDFSPRTINDWWLEHAAQAGEWVEIIFWK